MAVRTVIQAGHPSLKKKNKQILNFKSPKLKLLQKDLIDTMHKKKFNWNSRFPNCPKLYGFRNSSKKYKIKKA